MWGGVQIYRQVHLICVPIGGAFIPLLSLVHECMLSHHSSAAMPVLSVFDAGES